MTTKMRYLILAAGCLLLIIESSAQPSFASATAKKYPGCTPLRTRELFHDKVDAQQKKILAFDGQADDKFSPSTNEEINFLLTQAATQRIDALQCQVENDSTINGQVKIKYLKGLEEQLRYFMTGARDGKVSKLRLPDILTGYEKMYQLDKAGKSITPVINSYPYETAYALVNGGYETFGKNTGFNESKNLLILKYCLLYPAKTLKTLYENPDMPFADSLVRLVAKRYPKQLYDYAQSNSKLSKVIQNISDDNFIKTITQMARSKNGMQYFPFLDNILRGKTTLAEVDAAKDDSLKYYGLLVKTQIDYVQRLQNRDTAFEYKELTKRLERKARESFVNVINGLHNENAEVRFKSIQPLTAEELYYLAVSSDGSIYTSSFVRGVFPLMMKKISNRGDSLLVAVHFDKYRKLIKMCAGYNTLGTFLSSFPPRRNPGEQSDAEILMKSFVKNLEKSDGPEDAVDVADSYASIAETLKPLADEMLNNVEENYQRNIGAGNNNGIAIYKILKYLFLSADSTKNIDLTKELGIPPVYEVPFASLANDSGRVIMQQFFYGDKDGMGVFNGFVKQFSNANWKIVPKEKWVEVRSVKGKPVTIYANRALPEEGGEDEKAQKALGEYLLQSKLFPTVTVHRGHSYYADATIQQMAPTSRIVFLGSCGGYHLIKDVLEVSSDAHIVSTKQIGATGINKCFLKVLTDKVLAGKNIDWIPFWKEMRACSYESEIEDYTPPYKNLGALFIKAYKIAMEKEEAEIVSD
jgi:hypothetical protein